MHRLPAIFPKLVAYCWVTCRLSTKVDRSRIVSRNQPLPDAAANALASRRSTLIPVCGLGITQIIGWGTSFSPLTIFGTAIGEELGLLGALAVVGAFVVLLWRGLRASWGAPDEFGRFLAAGITLGIVFQAFINVSVVLGLLPPKGIPLPFISAGGSSLVFTLFGVGLVANVSQHGD